jgi:hypothetical protein
MEDKAEARGDDGAGVEDDRGGNQSRRPDMHL